MSDDLIFSASQLPVGKPTLLFAGMNQMNGGMGIGFGDGLLCRAVPSGVWEWSRRAELAMPSGDRA